MKIFYVAARIGRISHAAIERVCKCPASRHVTLIYSREWFPYKANTDLFPLVLEPPYTNLNLNGHSVLAATSAELSKRHDEFISAGAQWDFPGFIPHITLKGSHSALPDFPIVLACEFYGTWEQESE